MRVLSIGTGLGDVITIGNTRLSITNALKEMATSSKKIAATLDKQYGNSGQYHRFNVDQGLRDISLSDWDKASTISAHTRNYISENQSVLQKFVDDFASIAQVEERNVETSQTVYRVVHKDGDSPHEMPSAASPVDIQTSLAMDELGGAGSG